MKVELITQSTLNNGPCSRRSSAWIRACVNPASGMARYESRNVGKRGLDRIAVPLDGVPTREVEKDEVRTGEAVVNLGDLFGDGHSTDIIEAPAKVEVPVCFVDRMPLSGAWQDPTSDPPYDEAQLLFADCRTTHGTWSPTVGGAGIWWGWCDIERKFTALRPIGWRAMEPLHSG